MSKAAGSLLADYSHIFFVSAVTAWGIATKARIGKLDPEIARDFEKHISESDYAELPVSIGHGALAGALAGECKDPFDCILAAQAIKDLILLNIQPQLFYPREQLITSLLTQHLA